MRRPRTQRSIPPRACSRSFCYLFGPSGPFDSVPSAHQSGEVSQYSFVQECAAAAHPGNEWSQYSFVGAVLAAVSRPWQYLPQHESRGVSGVVERTLERERQRAERGGEEGRLAARGSHFGERRLERQKRGRGGVVVDLT